MNCFYVDGFEFMTKPKLTMHTENLRTWYLVNLVGFGSEGPTILSIGLFIDYLKKGIFVWTLEK